ncbi:hypothetical protein [Clostridium sp.]|uniref:hypothetical protein n=1 Tax=Clostridium sp. TaxID=1506 RepID=UPI00321743AE
MSEIKNFINSPYNFITVFLSLLFSVPLWIFQPDSKIPTYMFIISLSISFLLLWLLLINKFNNKEIAGDIRIIKTINNLCLCAPNKLLTQDSIVSFYYLNDGFEHLISYGIILNVQTNDLVQIEPKYLPNPTFKLNSDSLIDFIATNRKSIIIKPIITKQIIKNLSS